MPYAIKHGSGPRPWKIIKKNTGRVVGTSKTHKDAEASMRARYMKDKGKRKLYG